MFYFYVLRLSECTAGSPLLVLSPLKAPIFYQPTVDIRLVARLDSPKHLNPEQNPTGVQLIGVGFDQGGGTKEERISASCD